MRSATGGGASCPWNRGGKWPWRSLSCCQWCSLIVSMVEAGDANSVTCSTSDFDCRRRGARHPGTTTCTPSASRSARAAIDPANRTGTSKSSCLGCPASRTSEPWLSRALSIAMPAGVYRSASRSTSTPDNSTRLAVVSSSFPVHQPASAGLRRLGSGLASLFLLDLLPHRRRARLGLLHRDDQVAQHGVVEPEGVLEFVERRLAALDVDQHVVGLGHLLDRVGQLPPAPVLDPVDLALLGFDHRLVPLDHRGHLLALVGVDDQYDLVVTERFSWLG